jgi:hypothetical protein
MSTKYKAFEDFNAAYNHSSKFPEGSLERTPENLIHLIDDGNQSFFKAFETSMPRFYKVLIESCSPIHLLEATYIGSGLYDMGKEYKSYIWGLDCQGKLIVIEIPSPNQGARDEYFSCLPVEFHCFYQKMNGMAVSQFGTSYGYDLPACFSDWRGLFNYCHDNEIPLESLQGLLNDFDNDADLRVFIRCSLGDLVLLDFSAKDGKFYHIKNNNFSDYKLIKNAPQILDAYFANAVLGFPNEVVLS